MFNLAQLFNFRRPNYSVTKVQINEVDAFLLYL